MAPVELLPAPRRAAQEQTVLRGPLATTADFKQADQVVPLATTADSKQADPVDPPAKTADSEPTDPVGQTVWAEQPRLLVPESPLTDRDRPSQSLLSRSQAFKDQALTAQGAMGQESTGLLALARLRTSPGTLKALVPSTSAAKADFTPSTDPKAANAPAHRI